MSVLPSATFAGPSTAEALWAAAGSVGPGGGVTQLVAGSGIILDPSNGDGVVTITATGGGGGGGGVTSILSGGAGMGVSNPDGAVTLTNTGVTSLIAGTNITVSGSVGAVTVSAAPGPASVFTASLPAGGGALPAGVNGCVSVAGLFQPSTGNPAFYTANIAGPSWTGNDIYCVTLRQAYLSALSATPAIPPPQVFQATWNAPGNYLQILLWGTNTAIVNNVADTAPIFSVLRIAGVP